MEYISRYLPVYKDPDLLTLWKRNLLEEISNKIIDEMVLNKSGIVVKFHGFKTRLFEYGEMELSACYEITKYEENH